MTQHHVVWNGTRALGAYLFADEHPTMDAPKTEEIRAESPMHRARLTKGYPGWFTAKEFAELAGISETQAASAISQFRRRGEMQTERREFYRRSKTGLQRYQWIPS